MNKTNSKWTEETNGNYRRKYGPIIVTVYRIRDENYNPINFQGIACIGQGEIIVNVLGTELAKDWTDDDYDAVALKEMDKRFKAIIRSWLS